MKRSEVKLRRKMCASCHLRRAHFMFAGRVRWDRFHSLCFRCYRSLLDAVLSSLEVAKVPITQDVEKSLGATPTPVFAELEKLHAPAAASSLFIQAGEVAPTRTIQATP